MVRPLQSRAPAPPGAPTGGSAETAATGPFAGSRGEAFRRLRMGVLGMVAVLLLIGLASMIKDRATLTESTAVAGAAPTTAPIASETPADPLAEAGVVPDIPNGPTPSGEAASGAAPARDAR